MPERPSGSRICTVPTGRGNFVKVHLAPPRPKNKKTPRHFPPTVLFILPRPPLGTELLHSGFSYIKLMSLDNSHGTQDQDKTPVVNSTFSECCSDSQGEPTCSSCITSLPMVFDISPTMSSFVPRPFPPPTLEGVPESYIIHKLHEFAPKYWDKPGTADCTIGEILFSLTFLATHSHNLSSCPYTTSHRKTERRTGYALIYTRGAVSCTISKA